MGPNPYLWVLHAKQRLLEQNYKYLCVTALICGFCIHNSAFWTRISSLYGSQTSSEVLSTHNCVLNTRIKRLYVFQPSPVVLCMQNATLALELLVSMGPRPHLCFLQAKQRLLDQNNKSLWVPDITCRFVHAIQRDYHQNYLSLWIPTLICGFWMHNSVFLSRITSLYGSQT